MKTVYSLVWGIDVKKGGMTSVMLNRSKMLQDKGYKADIITLDYNINYEGIKEELIRIKKLDPRVAIKNVNDYYRKKNELSELNNDKYQQENNLHEEGFFIQDDQYNKNNYARYFKNGSYFKFKKWDKKGTLTHVDYFNSNRNRICREEYHPLHKYIHREVFFDFITNTKSVEKYYTTDGFCYLTKWYNPNDNILINVFLFNRETEKVTSFKNNLEFHTYWINELSKEETQKPFIICDGPGSSQKMINSDPSLTYKISVVHTNHFESPYTFGSEVKKNHGFLNQIEKLDKLVVLTERQKADIVKQFNHEKDIEVIPNSIPEKPLLDVTHSPKKVGMFVRYHSQKDIKSAILAFRIVVKRIKNATLEIYGHGPEKESIKKFIKDNNLEKNVFIKGYSKNVQVDIQKCVCTVLTSKFEAFGLSLAESMLYETPVIAFDCNYGPSDIIEDGKNGYIIHNRDIDLLAKKIIRIIKKPSVRKKLAKNGRKTILKKYSDLKVANRWIQLFDEIEEKNNLE